jgi:hypothetical protein
MMLEDALMLQADNEEDRDDDIFDDEPCFEHAPDSV